MFIRKKKNLIGIFLLLTLFAVIPIFGKLFNGFGYVCNRWMFAYAFLIAFIVVCELPEILNATKLELYILTGIAMIYFIILLLDNNLYSRQTVGGACLVGTVLLIDLLWYFKISIKFRYWAMIGVTVLTIGVFVESIYSPHFGRYTSEFIDNGKGEKQFKRTPVKLALDLKEEPFARVEQPNNSYNQSQVLSYYGTTFYYSIVPENLSKYYNELGMNKLVSAYSLKGQDYRAALNTLSATGYYAIDAENQGLLPFGCKLIKQGKKKHKDNKLYENTYKLPIGYAYDKYMKKSEYDKLGPIEKQEALMNGAVLDDKVATEVPQQDPKITTHELDSSVTETKGLTIQNNVINVTAPNAMLTIEFKGEQNCESYLVFKNLRSKEGQNRAYLDIFSDHSYNQLDLYDKSDNAFSPKEYHTVNLGYSKGGKTYCKVLFPNCGVFYMDSMKIVSYPMDSFVEQYKQLSKEKLEKVNVKNDKVTGEITVDNTRWVQFAIPYSEGWKAYVDGEKKEIHPSGVAYLGLELPKGTHKIELRYETPYLKLGAIMSILSVLCFCFRGKIKKRVKVR